MYLPPIIAPPIVPDPAMRADLLGAGAACLISTMSASAARAAADIRGLAGVPAGAVARRRRGGAAAALRAFRAKRATRAFSLRAATASGAARAEALAVFRADARAAFSSADKRARGALT